MELYPWYLEDSEETIFIEKPTGALDERPIKVAGMKRHDMKTLKRILERKTWNIDELADMEAWT